MKYLYVAKKFVRKGKKFEREVVENGYLYEVPIAHMYKNFYVELISFLSLVDIVEDVGLLTDFSANDDMLIHPNYSLEQLANDETLVRMAEEVRHFYFIVSGSIFHRFEDTLVDMYLNQDSLKGRCISSVEIAPLEQRVHIAFQLMQSSFHFSEITHFKAFAC